jgi:transcriptional regulator with XRE-family HTH domain
MLCTVPLIGDNVKRYRLLNTLTQEDLAKEAGISVTTLVRIERNQAEPHVSTIRKLADALEVSPRYLLEGEE